MALATNSFELMCGRRHAAETAAATVRQDFSFPGPQGSCFPNSKHLPGQTRTGSFIESVSNVAIGIGVAFISQELIFPFYGIHVSTRANLEIVAWFTAISLARSFLLRRLFNWITVR